MSKRIKDRKWVLNPPGANREDEEEQWLPHDISKDGKNVLLKKYDDGWARDFLLIKLFDDGHSTNMSLTIPKMSRLVSCNFLPNGDIFVMGYNSLSRDSAELLECIRSGEAAPRLLIMDTELRIKKDKIMPSKFNDVLMKSLDSIFSGYDGEYELARFILSGSESDYMATIREVGRGRTFSYNLYIKGYQNSGNLCFHFDSRLNIKKMPDSLSQNYETVNWSPLMTLEELNSEEFTNFKPPKHIPGRNWRRKPKIVVSTDSEERPIAFLFNAGREINVFKGKKQINIGLKFGQTLDVPPGEEFNRRHYGGTRLNNKKLHMQFDKGEKSLLVLSNLQYYSNSTYNNMRIYKWILRSYDLDGREAEMERTRLRIKGRWKLQSERKIRTQNLTQAGLPHHISKLIALNNIKDRDGIELFRYLRSSGAPNENINQKDFLEKIDEMAFSGELNKEDAKWLIENRSHSKLIEAIVEEKFSIERAKNILINLGFADFPEAVIRVVEGAEPETVAMIFGINSKNQPVPKITKTKFSPEKNENLPRKEERKRGFFRRKSRFS